MDLVPIQRAILRLLGGVENQVKNLIVALGGVLDVNVTNAHLHVEVDNVPHVDVDSLPAIAITNTSFETSNQMVAPQATHRSPEDFTVTYTSNITLTLSSHPTITNSAQIVYIRQVLVGNTSVLYINGTDGVTFGYAANVITIYGAGTPFVNTDVYEIGINYQDKAYDSSIDAQKVTELAPLWNRYTDYETLVAAQDLTNAYADYGAEIDMRGYTHLGIFLVADTNSSENVYLKALGKYENAGADECEIDGISAITLWGSPTPADFKKYWEFDCGVIPYIQLQAYATTVGATAGDLTIYIVKYYRP